MKTSIKPNTIMQTKIALKYEQAILVPQIRMSAVGFDNQSAIMGLSASMMQLGFAPSEKLMSKLSPLTTTEITDIYNNVMPELNRLKGNDADYVPMYPNFPQQVMEASELELFLNAITHYHSFGEWTPNYSKLPRNVKFENIKFQKIGVINTPEFENIYGKIVGANESLSEFSKDTIQWFVENDMDSYDGDIPFKENLCFLAALKMERGESITKLVKTATDVLRVATALSGGDISLAANTKFKSLSKRNRRQLCSALEDVASLEDIQRHRNKWIRLFHGLHVGDHSQKLFDMAKIFRNGKKVATFNSRIEKALSFNDALATAVIATERPGDFARRLDHILRKTDDATERNDIVDTFLSVADKVDTRVLMQLLGHVKTRGVDVEKRVVFPKGNVARATVLTKPLKALGTKIQTRLTEGINFVLIERFGKNEKQEGLGKVWIDEALRNCPVPTGQRSASEGLRQVARGTRLPFGDVTKATLRFFIYWIGDDIDLSATMHGENFEHKGQVSYTTLRRSNARGEFTAVHSGDITYAPEPKGACEFIDINIEKLRADGVRYIAMNVLVYNGPTFKEHEKVHAGWMTRNAPNSNEVFDAKTVEQRIDVTSESRNCIPVVFDLETREVIWMDVTYNSRTGYGERTGVNNTQANRANIQEIMEASANMSNKPNLYDLFELHTIASGQKTENREEAETIFSLDEGTTPYDITEIQSKYLT